MIATKRGKIVGCNGIQLPDQETIKSIEGDRYKYFGILKLDKGEMKKKFVKEYGKKLRLVLKSKLNGQNKILATNTWAVALLKYRADVLKQTKDEIAEMDRKARKFMTMYGAVLRSKRRSSFCIFFTLGGKRHRLMFVSGSICKTESQPN